MGNQVPDETPCARSLALRQRIGAMAAAIADTEEALADTLTRLARDRPRDAPRLRAKAREARRFAARERDQAAVYGRSQDGCPAAEQRGAPPDGP